MYAIVSCSLHPQSRSRVMAEWMRDAWQERGAVIDWVDLREIDLPWCDGGPCYGHPSVAPLGSRLAQARGIILAGPIYNYDLNAAAKNLVELTGKQVWTDKCVGFVCAAGGKVSYMAPMGLANSLMLDFHSLVLPRFVFATGGAFDEQHRLIDEDVQHRLTRLAITMTRVATAWHHSD